MKKFLIFLLFQSLIPALQASDSEFRYHYIEGCTGVPCVVTDSKGNNTHVSFSEDSDPAAMAILTDLMNHQDGIWGGSHPKESRGIKYDQGIILSGSFASAVKPYYISGILCDHYREFKVSNIKIKFPFARWKEVKVSGGDSLDDHFIWEFHFELCTLLPEGVIVNGKPLDLKKYEFLSDKNDSGLK